MTAAEFILKNYWRTLFPVYRQPGTLLKRNVRGETIGIVSGINLDQIGNTLSRAADSLEKVERVRKTIEEACKADPTGLPF